MQKWPVSEVNLKFIEKYQKILMKDPKSKVFAPLAEAYRKMGMAHEAISVANQGVKNHPQLVSGRVALGRALCDNNQFEEALEHLKIATDLSPDNLLAHSCLGKVYLRLREPKLALRSFKMALFLNPSDAEAQKVISKLESLTADEYDDDIFAMTDLKNVVFDQSGQKNLQREQPFERNKEGVTLKSHPQERALQRALQRALSLIDAFIIRNDIEKARKVIHNTKLEFGPSKELENRLRIIENRVEDSDAEEEPSEEAQRIKPVNYQQLLLEEKENKLKSLLHRVVTHKKLTEIN